MYVFTKQDKNISMLLNVVIIFILGAHQVMPEMRVVSIGESTNFTCTSGIELKWTFEDGPLPENANPVGENMLLINNVQLENSGFYYCEGYIKSESGSMERIYGRGLLRVNSSG